MDFQAILGGAAAILLLGVWDDAWSARARWKLLACCAISLAMYALGFRILSVSNPFGAPIQLGWLALPVTLFWFLGCINAINLVDGMDGLASGVVLFACAALFTTSMFFGNAPSALLSAALAGALLGFLVFNFHPASIFLGDSGSLLLGFLVACIGLRGAQKSQTVVALLIPVIALGLPIVDTALAILRRSLKALPFFVSDRQHIHHKLLEMGMSHRLAVLLMYGTCLVLAELALLMTAANSLQAAGLLAVLGLGTFLALRIIGRHEFQLLRRRLGGYAERRRQRLQCRAAGYVASASMRQVESVDRLWQVFTRAAERMQLDEAALTVFSPNGDGPLTFRWSGNGNGNGPAARHGAADAEWTAVFPLRTNGTPLGRLQVRWGGSRSAGPPTAAPSPASFPKPCSSSPKPSPSTWTGCYLRAHARPARLLPPVRSRPPSTAQEPPNEPHRNHRCSPTGWGRPTGAGRAGRSGRSGRAGRRAADG